MNMRQPTQPPPPMSPRPDAAADTRTGGVFADGPRTVAFAGDVLRFEPTADGYRWSQSENVRWLHALIGRLPSWRAAGVAVEMPSSDGLLSELRHVRHGDVWNEYRRQPETAWACRYDGDDTGEFAPFVDQLAEHGLVIGFELPPVIKRGLHRRSVPYLSVCIHPLRFLRDLAFGITTNSPLIADRLQALTVQPVEVDRQVRRFCAMFAKLQLPALSFPPGLPLVAGQTERDSVLISAGRFVGWDDFAAGAAEALRDHAEVLLLEHPLRPGSGAIADFLRSQLGKTVVMTNANAYGLLFSPQPPPLLVTLASSLGVEAAAVGIDARFLLADPTRKLSVAGLDIGEMRMVGHALLDDAFWRTLLLSDANAAVCPVDPFFLGDHYVRDGLASWAYRPLRDGFAGITTRKVLIPSARLEDGRRDELLACLLRPPSLPALAPQLALQSAAAVGVQLIVVEPVSPGPRRVVSLSGDAALAYLLHGFHPPESWGCWSGSLCCAIALPVSQRAELVNAVLSVSLPIRLFDGQLEHAPVLKISASGRVVAYVFFRCGAANPVDVRFSVPAQAPTCRIELELSRLGTPAAADDQRLLGIALTELTVACGHQVADGAPPTAECWLWNIGADPIPAPRVLQALQALTT